jgi:hypothetical protein
MSFRLSGEYTIGLHDRIFGQTPGICSPLSREASTGDLIARTTNDTQVLYGIAAVRDVKI